MAHIDTIYACLHSVVEGVALNGSYQPYMPVCIPGCGGGSLEWLISTLYMPACIVLWRG